MPSPEFENLAQMFSAQRSTIRPSVDELRPGYDLLGDIMPIAEGVEITDKTLGNVAVDFLTPEGASGKGTIVFFHGGGYCIGSRKSHRPLAMALAKQSGLTVVAVDYRLAPEHPFPAAYDDARAVYEAVLEEPTTGSEIVLVGDSAGAGLALALQVGLRDDGRPLPACSILISPWTDLSAIGEMSDVALELDYLRPEALEVFTESYLAGAEIGPRNSPLGADLTGLPPILIHGGEHEILLDQIRRLASHAKDCGIDVTLEVEPGMFHDWHVFPVVPEAQDAIARVARFANEHLA